MPQVMPQPAPIEVRGLVKRYGELVAVDDVDLTVEAGDVFGYLGPNGAGKTTSLRMMLGLIRPSAGTVRLFGRDPQVSVAALEGVAGFVEAPSFYPYLNGRENLRLLAALDGDEAASRIEESLSTVGLAERAKDRVGGYSHGMRQRLGIAAALLRKPRLLMLDEPATGLDPGGMRDMRDLIRQLSASGMTVLLSSHLLTEVEEVCNRVAIVRSGRVAYQGRLDDLRAQAGDGYQLRTTEDGIARARRRGAGRDHRGAPGAGRRPHLQRRRPGRGLRALALAGRVGSADRGAEPAPRDPRGPLLQPHRGRRRRRAARRARPGAGAGVSPGVLTVYRWELRKLRAQKRTYLGLGAAAIVPIIFVVALVTQNGQPEDVSFGRYLHSTGLAVPLVLLLFGSVWMFPLITALVAGDIVAAEDRNQTLKTILTRSVERQQIFAGKTLATFTYAIAAIAVTGAVALVAGILASGFNSITTLSGTQVSAGEGLGLVGLSLLFYLVPILAIASIGLLFSTVFRNSAAAIVGTLMFSLLVQLIGILPGLGGIHPYLLSTQFNAWQGFLRSPVDWTPVIRALWVCAIYGVPALFAAALVFLRRDVAGD